MKPSTIDNVSFIRLLRVLAVNITEFRFCRRTAVWLSVVGNEPNGDHETGPVIKYFAFSIRKITSSTAAVQVPSTGLPNVTALYLNGNYSVRNSRRLDIPVADKCSRFTPAERLLRALTNRAFPGYPCYPGNSRYLPAEVFIKPVGFVFPP